jgi:hypothetical protein
MFLHLGGDTVSILNAVIGVFDLDNATVGRDTKKFLKAAQENGLIYDICEDIPKAFVLCGDNGSTKIYITQVSTATLRKRANDQF